MGGCCIVFTTLLGIFCFGLGYFCANNNILEKLLSNDSIAFLIGIIDIAFLIIITCKYSFICDFRIAFFSNKLLIVPSVLGGLYLIIWISRLIEKIGGALALVLTSIGRNTMPILLFHMFWFQVVGYFQRIVYGSFGNRGWVNCIFDDVVWCLITMFAGITLPYVFHNSWIYIKNHK